MTTENEIKPAAPAETLDGGHCAVADGSAPSSFFYPLFEHLSREHGLTLLESELAEIVSIAGQLASVPGELDGGDMREGWLMVKVPVSPAGLRMGQPVRVILPNVPDQP